MILDAIEKKSKELKIETDIIKEILEGKQENYIKCLNVDYESKNE